MPEIDIWYDRVDVDELIGYLAPYDADELGSWIERKAHKRTSRGASTKLTQVVDGHRTIIEDPPFRTHLQAVGDTDPEAIVAAYRGSVSDPVWSFLTRFDIADMVRQIVGVGSVGMRVYLVLLVERRTGDPFFLQIKQAVPSVYERFLGASPYGHHGERVINGQRMIQSATDMFVGWTTNDGHDFYVRQLRDGKVIPKGESSPAGWRSSRPHAGECWPAHTRAAVTPPRSTITSAPAPKWSRLSWLSRRPTPTRMNETTRSSPGQSSRVRSRARSAGPSVGDYGPTPSRYGSVCALVIGRKLSHVASPF